MVDIICRSGGSEWSYEARDCFTCELGGSGSTNEYLWHNYVSLTSLYCAMMGPVRLVV